MGRWKRKQQLQVNSKASLASNPALVGSTENRPAKKKEGLSRKDTKLLHQYLIDYRKGVERQYYLRNNSNKNDSDNESNESTILKSNAVTKIADIQLPKLTDIVFAGPFLQLPCGFALQQRKIIHQTCIQVDLYHVGVGPSNNRTILISFYADGFEYYHENVNDTIDTKIPLHRYSPLVCRLPNDEQKVLHDTCKQEIYKFIDQPGTCLRDNIDDMDYQAMQGVTLATNATTIATAILVDTPEKLQQCVQDITESNPTELAFDLECYNPSKYTQITCLLQLSINGGQDYVIDTLAPNVWDAVPLLRQFFHNPSIVKIGHSIGGIDVKSLQRDFGIYIINVFDTFEAAKVLQLPEKGLSKICSYYGMDNNDTNYNELKATYQSCDWRQRPLTPEMLQYGQYDVHYLIQLRQLFIRDLTKQELWDGGGGSNSMLQARQVAASLAIVLAKCDDYDDDDIESEGGSGILLEMDRTVSNNKRSDNHIFGQNAGGFSFDDNDGNEVENGDDDDDDDDDDDLDKFRTPMDQSMDMPPDSDSCGDNSSSGDEIASTGTNELAKNGLVTAAQLRLNGQLMTCISKSQDRCLEFWKSHQVEPHLKNSELLAVLQQQQSSTLSFSNLQMQLYERLVTWRNIRIARDKFKCLPGFVCSLDFLVTVALKRPKSKHELQLISYQLPNILHENVSPDSPKTFLQELLEIVQDNLEQEHKNIWEISKVPHLQTPFFGPRDDDEERKRSIKLSPASTGKLSSIVFTTPLSTHQPYYVAGIVVAIAAVAGVVLSNLGRSKKYSTS